MYSSENLQLTGLRCWIDFLFFDSLLLDKRKKSGFAKENGVIRGGGNAREALGRLINRHGKDQKSHAFIAFLLEKTKAETIDQFQQWLIEINDELFEATDNLYLSRYYSDWIGVSYNKSPFVIELQKRTGSHMGHIYAQRKASAQLTLIIYDIWHKELVTYLKSLRSVGLMCDESTLYNTNYILIMLQGIYKNAPQIWFYKVLINHDGSGEGLFNAILDQWRVNG